MKELRNNRFHEMRKELARISRERSVDIDVALSILAQEKGLKDWGKESMDFKSFLAGMDGEDYKAYFAE